MDEVSGLRARVMTAIGALGLPSDDMAAMVSEMDSYINHFGLYIEERKPVKVTSDITSPVSISDTQSGLVGKVTTTRAQDFLEVQKFFENSYAIDWYKSVVINRSLTSLAYEKIDLCQSELPTSVKWHIEVATGSPFLSWGENSIVLEPNIPYEFDVPVKNLYPILLINDGDDCEYVYWFTRDEITPIAESYIVNSEFTRSLFSYLEYQFVMNKTIRGKDPGEDIDCFLLYKLCNFPT
jgi:hypothetical protein